MHGDVKEKGEIVTHNRPNAQMHSTSSFLVSEKYLKKLGKPQYSRNARDFLIAQPVDHLNISVASFVI